VEVSNLVEAGESEAALYNNETEIGKLRALKYRPPFAVKLNTATPDNPELSFEQGKPSQMIIKNDDPMTYPISWELLIGEKTITGTDVILPPSSSKTVPIDTPNEWFTSGFAGLFKDEIRDGTLTLSFQPPLSSSYPLMAQKVIPFKARLRNWSPNLQYILGIPLVFVFLFLGALCSLMLRDWGPNRLQRVKIEEKLGEVEKETQWLSQRLKISSLIVPLRVERTRLLERLRSPVFFSPELPAIFEQCNDGIEILKNRLAILRDLDEAYERIWEKRRKHVPPALLSKVNDTLGQTSTMLRRIDPKEKNLDQVKMLIGSARQILDRLDKMAKKDEWLAKDLANRVKLMRQKFDEKEKIRAMETFIEIENRFPHMLPALDAKYEDKANITPNEYAEIDLLTSFLDLISDFVPFYENGSKTLDTEGVKKLEKCHDDFLKSLSNQNFDGLERASLMLREVRDGIFSGSIEEAIKADPPQISLSTSTLNFHANQPIQLRVEFKKDELSKAAARDEIECIWDFKRDDFLGNYNVFTSDHVKEKGWSVWHYFPKPGKYIANVSFRDRRTGELIKSNNAEVSLTQTFEVGPDTSPTFSERTRIEVTWFVIALFAALLALVAGAREQLLKLDVAAGLIAVFLIGFSTDTLKNLLTQPSRETARK